MKKIILITDYKGNFGSKRDDFPYRSGMNIKQLVQLFNNNGYEVSIISFAEAINTKLNFENIPVIYTSTEDSGYIYKSFIEDVIFGLELRGANLLPAFKYLRATNNKVFMEILRNTLLNNCVNNITSEVYGCYEDFIKQLSNRDFPLVIKEPGGAKSRGVYLSYNQNDSIKIIKKITRTPSLKEEVKDLIRALKHKGYITDSRYRNKFIIQDFIQGLDHDYKVLVYGKKFYVLKRNNRPNDFRASGSGLFEFTDNIPFEVLDYAEKVFNIFRVPNLSLDIAVKDSHCFLLEFQAVYFGTTTLVKSPFYFERGDEIWTKKEGKSILEEEFVNSIVNYLNV